MLDRICRFMFDCNVSEAKEFAAVPFVGTLFYVTLTVILTWIGGAR